MTEEGRKSQLTTTVTVHDRTMPAENNLGLRPSRGTRTPEVAEEGRTTDDYSTDHTVLAET